jgi:hypothetical protein
MPFPQVVLNIDPSIISQAAILFPSEPVIGGVNSLVQGNTLTLPLMPDGYPPFSNDFIANEVLPGFAAATVRVKLNYRSSSIRVRDGFYRYWWIVAEQARLAIANPAQYQLITMKDYFRVEPEDCSAGYTERTVTINSPQYDQAFPASSGEIRLPNGWEFEFTEIF